MDKDALTPKKVVSHDRFQSGHKGVAGFKNICMFLAQNLMDHCPNGYPLPNFPELNGIDILASEVYADGI